MTKLSKPKRVREHKAKCCNNCAYLCVEGDGTLDDYMICQRDPNDTPWANFGDAEMGIYMVVCDGHELKSK